MNHARHQAARQARQAIRLRRIEKELHTLKGKNAGDGSSNTTPSTAPTTSSGSLTTCSASVSAGPDTTCPFALNVAQAYYESGGSNVISAYSPVTGSTYSMTCSGSAPTVCNGGNNATVYIAP